MTHTELKPKLDELLRLPAETEWVEFKEAKSNLDSDDLGKYFAALCNEANLKDQPVGWLVFGVQDTVVALDKVQKRKPLTPEELKHLRRLKLVEGRAPNVFVASRIAAITGDKAQYIRNRAFDTAHYKQMILDFIREFGVATRKDIDSLILDKLSDTLTAEQKKNRIKNILHEMAKQDQTILNQGSDRASEWILVNKPDGKNCKLRRTTPR